MYLMCNRFYLLQGIAVLQLQAVADDVPEEREIFYVTLLPPGGATLGAIARKTVTIERNDAPYGLLEIFIAGSK